MISILSCFCAYTVTKKKEQTGVGKLTGFMLFFIGVGMVLGILITENFIVISIAVVCLLCGYHMILQINGKCAVSRLSVYL